MKAFDFLGAGGLTRGLLDAGIAGVDSDALCREAYEKNAHARIQAPALTGLCHGMRPGHCPCYRTGRRRTGMDFKDSKKSLRDRR